MKWRWPLLCASVARTSRSVPTHTPPLLPHSSCELLMQESEAMSHVAGYMVAHDVSARDWQLHRNGGQWLIGKTFDTFSPLGPAIVTTPSLSGEHSHSWFYHHPLWPTDPHNLGIRCRLNGETVQNSNTNQLVHKTQGLVTFLSRYVCYLLLFYYTLPPPPSQGS